MHSVLITSLLICNVGGPGTASQAKPVVDKFLRHMEKHAGWKKGALEGAYKTKLSDCQRYIDQKKPKIIVADLPTYLSHHKKWKLQPVAHMGKATAKRYYLLVREGSVKKLSGLKEKTVVTPLAKDAKFVSSMVLDNKLDASKQLKLKYTRRPLRGLRKVARERADATIVDETAHKYLSQLKLPKKLAVLAKSKPLPGLTLTVVKGSPRSLSKRILKALPKLCTGTGKDLCKTFQIKSFNKANPRIYRKLVRRYR